MNLPDLDDLSFETQQDRLLAYWTAKLFQYPLLQKKLKQTGKGAERRFGSIDFDELPSLLGLSESGGDFEELGDKEKAAFFNQLTLVLSNQNAPVLSLDAVLHTNLQALAQILDLNDTEVALLHFFVLLKTHQNFDRFCDELGDLNKDGLVQVLSWVLDLHLSDVRQAFSQSSVLYWSGLLKMDLRHSHELSDKVDLLRGLEDVLLSKEISPQTLLDQYFRLAEVGHLQASNFPHLASQMTHLEAYFANNRHKGMNVLIYGPPGTGKTEWVKLMAQTLGKQLYEISDVDEDGEAVDAKRRVNLYQLAQRALRKNQQSLLMFDEVEDVFPSRFDGMMLQTSKHSKSWLNRLLEDNPVPSFWISNAVHQIDPAYLRRFDMVIEMDIPPRSVRKQIIDHCLLALNVREDWKEALAEHKYVSPALISRMASVVLKSKDHQDLSSQQTEQKLLQLINATLSAQSMPEINIKSSSQIRYSLDYVNTDIDLSRLLSGLKNQQAGRICLYGLPGTGKTALGHHIAKTLDKPLLLKKASDLLSPYVGEAEKNIAAAFKEAQREGAVLQIDEADSFLQSRENAQRSWEVSQVNELLTQMESFEGVFIASTNFMDHLDSAAMRRFDMKLELKPLEAEQAFAMALDFCEMGSLDEYGLQSFKQVLAGLSQLTPGDFATLSRKMRLMGGTKLPAHEVLELLTEECRYKPYAQTQGIGFLSHLN